MAESQALRWYKSSYSSNGGDCVEVATDLDASHGTVPVRDSKVLDGPVLRPTVHAFSALVTGIKSGDLQAR
ncbi:DUF397 domain-containing protein [Streptomyces sp. NPDC087440]|uniref:DUF397 domain-containing protein n=1 Tax=Streptomyces sp. NPDC087440 TaxID=3365790 RepID=UPI00381DFB50